jgi:hypothetical protein
MSKLFTIQHNKVFALDTKADRQMKNDIRSASHNTHNPPAMKPGEDLAFGDISDFVSPECVNKHIKLDNDLYEHTF